VIKSSGIKTEIEEGSLGNCGNISEIVMMFIFDLEFVKFIDK
jgi:hypothetical protein